MHDVEYCNNISEWTPRMFSAFHQIPYRNRFVAGTKRIKILMNVYAMCVQRGVNFYQFVQDCLSDKYRIILFGPELNGRGHLAAPSLHIHDVRNLAPKTFDMHGA